MDEDLSRTGASAAATGGGGGGREVSWLSSSRGGQGSESPTKEKQGDRPAWADEFAEGEVRPAD